MGNHNSVEEARTDIHTEIKNYINNEVNECVKILDTISNTVINTAVTSNEVNVKNSAISYQKISFVGAHISNSNFDVKNLSEMKVKLESLANICTNDEQSNEIGAKIQEEIAQKAATDIDLQSKLNAVNFIQNKTGTEVDGEINNMIDNVSQGIQNILTSSKDEKIRKTQITNIVTTEVTTKLTQTTDIEHLTQNIFKTDITHNNLQKCVSDALNSQDINFDDTVISGSTINSLNTSVIELGPKCFLTNMTISNNMNTIIQDYFEHTDADSIVANRVKNEEAMKNTEDTEKNNKKTSFFGDFMNSISYIAVILGVVAIIAIIAFVFFMANRK